MFRLDEEHLELQASFKEFAENEIRPLAKEIDETERFPLESIKKMAEMGMMGLPIPEEYGGSGVDQLGYVLEIEELAKVCATTAIIVSAHTSLCCWPILKFGTEEQKQKYLIPLARFLLSRQPEIIYTAELLDANENWKYGITADGVREAFSLITTEWAAGDN